MQKVVVLRKSIIEEVDWDGSIKGCMQILGIQDWEIYDTQEKSCEYHYSTLDIRADECSRSFDDEFQESFIYDGIIYNQEVILIGMKQIMFDAPILRYNDVVKKVKFSTPENNYLENEIYEIEFNEHQEYLRQIKEEEERNNAN